jgi:hypothetical protein
MNNSLRIDVSSSEADNRINPIWKVGVYRASSSFDSPTVGTNESMVPRIECSRGMD